MKQRHCRSVFVDYLLFTLGIINFFWKRWWYFFPVNYEETSMDIEASGRNIQSFTTLSALGGPKKKNLQLLVLGKTFHSTTRSFAAMAPKLAFDWSSLRTSWKVLISIVVPSEEMSRTIMYLKRRSEWLLLAGCRGLFHFVIDFPFPSNRM